MWYYKTFIPETKKVEYNPTSLPCYVMKHGAICHQKWTKLVFHGRFMMTTLYNSENSFYTASLTCTLLHSHADTAGFESTIQFNSPGFISFNSTHLVSFLSIRLAWFHFFRFDSARLDSYNSFNSTRFV